MAHGPSCSAACGIFPDQGSNPCPLHWQADAQPLRHQGSPESILLKLPTNKRSEPDGLVVEFNQIFREELTPILLKLFEKTVEEGTLQNSFYEASLTMIPKPNKGIKKNPKLQANVTKEHRFKNPQRMLAN